MLVTGMAKPAANRIADVGFTSGYGFGVREIDGGPRFSGRPDRTAAWVEIEIAG
jgi:hypothetical protein